MLGTPRLDGGRVAGCRPLVSRCDGLTPVSHLLWLTHTYSFLSGGRGMIEESWFSARATPAEVVPK